MTTQIKLRRDTAANWVSANPVLALGEPGLETDTRQIKYGDGSSAWNSLLYSTAGASTGAITFTDNTMTATDDVYLLFTPSASPAVSFSFTSSGILNSPIINTSSINVAGAKHSTTQSTECLPNVDTVVFTGSSYGTATLKALFHVEGVETVDLESQSCEMMVAVMSPRVAGSVYGLAYTSSAPLATFTARWNSVSQLVEITCRPTSTTENVRVQTTTIELSILAP